MIIKHGKTPNENTTREIGKFGRYTAMKKKKPLNGSVDVRMRSGDGSTQRSGSFFPLPDRELAVRRLRSSYTDRGAILLRSCSVHQRDRVILHHAAP